MMRQVVLSGTATALAGRGEVYGKTGTAEFGSKTPPDSHGWFMGYRLGGPAGDLAFAVLVEARSVQQRRRRRHRRVPRRPALRLSRLG